jgi:hypothetical protein
MAREPFKRALGRWTNPSYIEHFRRVFYGALSFAALYYDVATLHWARHPENDVWLIVYPGWLWQAIKLLHLGSKRSTTGDLFGAHRLVVTGVYAGVRPKC